MPMPPAVPPYMPLPDALLWLTVLSLRASTIRSGFIDPSEPLTMPPPKTAWLPRTALLFRVTSAVPPTPCQYAFRMPPEAPQPSVPLAVLLMTRLSLRVSEAW